MLKISDYSDGKFCYIYSADEKELKKAKELFKSQTVKLKSPIFYKGIPAFMIRKSN